MKRIKHICSFVCLLAALATLLTALPACGGGEKNVDDIGRRALDFTEVYVPLDEDVFYAGYQKAEKIALLEGKTVTALGDLLMFKENKNYCFYESDANRVVLQIPTSSVASAEDITAVGEYLCVVTKDGDRETTSIYGKTGELYASVDGREIPVTDVGGFLLQGKLYRIKDDKRTGVYTMPPFAGETVYSFTEHYAMICGSAAVTLYDEALTPVLSYAFPNGAGGTESFYLGGDSVLLQYRLACPVESTDYDYINGGNKYTIHHVLLDGENKKVRECDLGVLIGQVYNRDAKIADGKDVKDVFTDRVPCIMQYYTVVNGYLARARYAVLGLDGKVGAALDTYVEGQRGLILPHTATEYSVMTDYGYAIVNAEGKEVSRRTKLGVVKEYGYLDASHISSYSPGDVNVYDTDLNLVEVLEDVASVLNTDVCFMYSKDTNDDYSADEYYRYDKNGKVRLPVAEDQRASFKTANSYYVLSLQERVSFVYETVSQVIYSLYGEVLYEMETFSSSAAPLVSASESAVFADTVDGSRVYIRLSK